MRGLEFSRIVERVEVLDDYRVKVIRKGMRPLSLHLTNHYILAVADVMEILEESPRTDCIISTMDYNRWTPEAKQYCAEAGVALLHAKEVWRAVALDGDELLDYTPSG